MSNTKTLTASPFITACCAPKDVTDTAKWDDYQLDRQLYLALSKQLEAAQSSVVTEADALVALFDQMLLEVSN